MSDEPIRELSDAECWDLLGRAPIGRLALAVRGEVDIFPINFVVSDGAVYFRTAPGTKLVELTINDRVALEVDEFGPSEARSVVLKGRAEELEHSAEIEEAEKLGLVPWAATLKYRWVRVHAEELSGRLINRLVPEPSRDL